MNDTYISGVIFDFNGTLFNDTDFHDQAWKEFAGKYGKKLNNEDLRLRVHGAANRSTLEYLFEKSLSDKEFETFSEQKETIYRNLCINNPKRCKLARGATEFLDFLKKNNIPRTIATASVKKNLDFYFDMLPLEKWFDKKKIIFDNGKYRGKPFPDLFLAAAKALSLPINECLIIEDSLGGIQAAKNAKAAAIIAINFTSSSLNKIDDVDQFISDFRQIKISFKQISFK